MKIHFKIPYYTHWGQRLLVSGNIPELGNGDRTKALSLNFQAPEDWIAEVDIKSDVPFQLNYKYILYTEQNDQYIEEWGNDRLLSLDPEKADHYFSIDAWNSPGSIENVFLTSPFQEVLLRHDHFTAKQASTIKYTHLFKVKMPMLKKNEVICLIGNCEALGNWSTLKPVVMSQTEGNWWSTEVDLSKLKVEVHYKYGVYDPEMKLFRYFE